MLHVSLLIVLLTVVGVRCDESVSVEVGSDGAQEVVEEETKHPNSLEVIFENQSGRKVELYWDDNVNGVLQSELSHTGQITINTYIGHRFYFTPAGSGGDKASALYKVAMERHTGIVTLYDERTMKERGEEFEKQKNEFMKSYLDRTGMRWKNYYPREPLTHFMYNFTNIGQQIDAKSSHAQYTDCSAEVIEQVADNIKQQTDADEGAEPRGNKTVPKFYPAETDAFDVLYHNGSYFCRDKSQTDLTFTINVLCAGPKVAYFDNFLSPQECEHIKAVGQTLGLLRSTVSEEALQTEDRTSSTVWIERKHSPIINNIVQRIADVVNIDESKLYLNQSSESLQLVHYEPGQLYKSHVDYGTDRPHNRYITFLMYLNTVGGGGFTSFPKAPKECKNEDGYFGVEPVQGRVAFFYDLLADGNVDDLTQHYAEPPTEGNEKWMTNLWIWDAVFTR